jgi:hypothetical protein
VDFEKHLRDRSSSSTLRRSNDRTHEVRELSEKLMPSACEVDVAGTVTIYALQLASGKPWRAERRFTEDERTFG